MGSFGLLNGADDLLKIQQGGALGGHRGSALDGPAISEEEHEVTLTEERPVVAKETVPVERVKLTKDTEQHEEQVSEEVRKERIEADGDVERTTGRTQRQ